MVRIRLAALSLLVAATAYAHDHNRPDLKEWFSGLHGTGNGQLCCSGSDALVLKDPDWESKDGHYRVRIEGKWIDVPDEAVIKEPNLDGQTMVWPIMGYLGTTIRCFMVGAQG